MKRSNAERARWYRWISRLVIDGCRHPVIVIDWADLDPNCSQLVLRAAVAVGGRALPIYEEVHSRFGNRRLYERFLHRLKAVLGEECEPILVTDACFRTWWFGLVEKMGWYYVGHIRNVELVRWRGGSEYFSNKVLHHFASARPKALGELWLSR